MGHYFNGSDCSLSNLVWAPLDKISDNLTEKQRNFSKLVRHFGYENSALCNHGV